MFHLLEKIFIKRKLKDKNENQVRTIYGTFCSILGIICNIILSLAKLIIGFISGIISIVADGINNLTDSASSIATLIGFKLAAAPPDKDHPFGHERIEYLTGMIVSLLVLLAGILLGKESVMKIINFEQIDLTNFYIMVGILSFSILLKCWMGIVYKKTGRKINSLTIEAAAQDSFNDCISTGVVVLTLVLVKVFGWTNFPIDGILGLGVSIFILINGIGLVKETMSPLIGEKPDKDFTKNVTTKILSYPHVLGIHDLVMHSYGPNKYFITVHIEVDASIDVMISHEVIDEIERDFRTEGIELTGHLDPIDVRDELTNKLKSIVAKIVIDINQDLKEENRINFHDFRIVKGEHNTNVLFDIVNPYGSNFKDDEIKELINKKFQEEVKDYKDMVFRLVLDVDKDFVH